MLAYRKVKLVYYGSLINVGNPIKTSQDAVARIKHDLSREPTEVFVALLLDGRHYAIGEYEISRGTLTTSLVHPRETFRIAIKKGAAAIIVAHNHPSGNPYPSQEDKSLTDRLVKTGNLIGIPVIDHIIIGSNINWSLRETNSEIFTENY